MTDTTDTADKTRHKLRMCRRDRDAKRKQNTKLLRERARLERENAALRTELENLKLQRLVVDDIEDTRADLIAEQRRHSETLDKLDVVRAELQRAQVELDMAKEQLRQCREQPSKNQTLLDVTDEMAARRQAEAFTGSNMPSLGRGPTHLPEQSSSAGMRRFFPWFRKP